MHLTPGDKFGKLLVVRQTGRASSGHLLWECHCECGNTIIRPSSNIKKMKGCGCLWKKHGRSNTPEYKIWTGMKARCQKRNSKLPERRWAFQGIQVCPHWKDSFINFLADMGQRPSPDHEIDRINNNGHYSCGHCDYCTANGWPANCRWVSQKGQARNRTNNVLLTYKGETHPLIAWANKIGVSWACLKRRLQRGYSVSKALETPLFPNAKKYRH